MGSIRWILLCLLGMSASSYGEAPLRVHAILIDEVFEKNRNSSYDAIVSEAFARTGYQVPYESGPLPRVVRAFNNKQIDCFMPSVNPELQQTDLGIDRSIDSTTNPVRSNAFHKAAAYIYYKSKPHSLNSWETNNRNGLSLSVLKTANEWNVLSFFGLQADRVFYGTSVVQLVQQIHSGRSDALVFWHPLPVLISKKLNLTPLYYNAAQPISIDHFSITCEKSPRTIAFIEKVNAAIFEMWADGTMPKLLGDAYVEGISEPDGL